MADVWIGRISRFVEKFLNIKGGPSIVDIDPSIRLSLPLQQDAGDFYLQSIFRYAAILGQAAVTAQQAGVQLRNPAGSNVILIVEHLGIGPAVATVSTYHVTQGPSQQDLATTLRGFRLDARSNPNSTGIVSGGNNVSIDLTNIIFTTSGTNSNGMIPVNQGFQLPILPGDLIRVSDQTVNEAFTVEFLWRERPLESSELT